MTFIEPKRAWHTLQDGPLFVQSLLAHLLLIHFAFAEYGEHVFIELVDGLVDFCFGISARTPAAKSREGFLIVV